MNISEDFPKITEDKKTKINWLVHFQSHVFVQVAWIARLFLALKSNWFICCVWSNVNKFNFAFVLTASLLDIRLLLYGYNSTRAMIGC